MCDLLFREAALPHRHPPLLRGSVCRIAHLIAGGENREDVNSLLREFGIQLKHFGMRGNAQWGQHLQLFIRLDTGQWSVKKQSSKGWTLVARDFGIETFRTYLKLNGPRSYSMAVA